MNQPHIASLPLRRHDLDLPAWGPYGKVLNGVAHIADAERGLRLELGFAPGIMRRTIQIPDVLIDSGYAPTQADPSLHWTRWEYRLSPDEGLSVNFDVAAAGADARLLRATCSSTSQLPNALGLHFLLSLYEPPERIYSRDPWRPASITMSDGAQWCSAMAATITITEPWPQVDLVPDALRPGEQLASGAVGGSVIGIGPHYRPWWSRAEDTLTWTVSATAAQRWQRVAIRYRASAAVAIALTYGAQAVQTVLPSSAGAFVWHVVNLPAGDGDSAEVVLALRAITDQPGGQCDGIAFMMPGAALPEITMPAPLAAPTIEPGPVAGTLVVCWPALDQVYGLAWDPGIDHHLRHVSCADPAEYLRRSVHSHVGSTWQGTGCGHHVDVFLRPVMVPGGGTTTVDMLICSGSAAAVRARLLAHQSAGSVALQSVMTDAQHHWQPANSHGRGAQWAGGRDLMAAILLTNVVYPVRCHGGWIRHHTPGRTWDCLYTWDSGFIALALAALDQQRSYACLAAYLTDLGANDQAFVHHGTPLPIQVLAALELWNRRRDRAQLAWLRPRLERMVSFIIGRHESSTCRLPSGLLRTFDYFYNSGGWDDYPAQVQVHAEKLSATTAPAVSSAVAIRCCRILAGLARRSADADADNAAQRWDAEAQQLQKALDAHAWDAAEQVYSYTRHDSSGQPQGPLRHVSGANANRGLDGTSPLYGGMVPAEHATALVTMIADPKRLWSAVGVQTVDASAPYWRRDGYWNGTVWFPHQWLLWKALLDLGETELAIRIATTALTVWGRETTASGRSCEHFPVISGRGAGWHHFGGLSSPIVLWYESLCTAGTITGGFDCWIDAVDWTISATGAATGESAVAHRHLRARLDLAGVSAGLSTVIVCLDEAVSAITATWNDVPVITQAIQPGTWAVAVPRDGGIGTLIVHARD